MSLEKLWKDIGLLYNEFNFSILLKSNRWRMEFDGVPESIRETCNIDGLTIFSKDNYYTLYYKSNDLITCIRIEKDYNLINMWGLGKLTEGEFNKVDYKISVQVGDMVLNKLDDIKIELAYKIMNPFLREVKLKKIGI